MATHDEVYSFASSALSACAELEESDRQEIERLGVEVERLTKLNKQLQRENSLHRMAVNKLNREMKRIDSGGW